MRWCISCIESQGIGNSSSWKTCEKIASELKKEKDELSQKRLNEINSKLTVLEQEEKELNAIKGTQSNIEFGSQIRSYVMHPYSMVKDHRTNYETGDVSKVMDGYIDEFIEEYLRKGVE